MAIDLIGDVHGHADHLEALLTQLGYARRNGAWRHPDNRALFIGDLIDRGPRQLDCIRIAREMRDAGIADILMGNHEFNAIAFATPDPLNPGAHCRKRNAANIHQHASFLREVGLDSAMHHEAIEFFRTLPIWIEAPDFRAVHACWEDGAMAALAPHLTLDTTLTRYGFLATQDRSGRAYADAELVLKGPEVDLPDGVTFKDAGGTVRDRTRVRWWLDGKPSLRRKADMEEDVLATLPDDPHPDVARVSYEDRKPLFFGHYWFSGRPSPVADNLACLDFSVAKGGPLVAYRFGGEPTLNADNLTWVGEPALEDALQP